jgi:hypothetical protein
MGLKWVQSIDRVIRYNPVEFQSMKRINRDEMKKKGHVHKQWRALYLRFLPADHSPPLLANLQSSVKYEIDTRSIEHVLRASPPVRAKRNR